MVVVVVVWCRQLLSRADVQARQHLVRFKLPDSLPLPMPVRYRHPPPTTYLFSLDLPGHPHLTRLVVCMPPSLPPTLPPLALMPTD